VALPEYENLAFFCVTFLARNSMNTHERSRHRDLPLMANIHQQDLLVDK
jgi:hypothetical protein